MLQRDETCIHILKSAMERLRKKLANQIVELDKLKDVSSVFDVDLEEDEIWMVARSVFIGITIKLTLNSLK